MSGLLSGVGVGDGVAVGLGVGVTVGVGTGVGEGTGEVHKLPSKLPGFTPAAVQGATGYALDAKAIHFPSLLICGLLFDISTLMLLIVGGPKWLFVTLFVLVI